MNDSRAFLAAVESLRQRRTPEHQAQRGEMSWPKPEEDTEEEDTEEEDQPRAPSFVERVTKAVKRLLGGEP